MKTSRIDGLLKKEAKSAKRDSRCMRCVLMNTLIKFKGLGLINAQFHDHQVFIYLFIHFNLHVMFVEMDGCE